MKLSNFFSRLEFDQHVNITLAILLIADKGAEATTASDPTCLQLLLMLSNECEQLCF